MNNLLFVFALVFLSCRDDEYWEQMVVEDANNQVLDSQVIEFEGCEYLVYHGYKTRAMTHKGKCSNTIHSYNN